MTKSDSKMGNKKVNIESSMLSLGFRIPSIGIHACYPLLAATLNIQKGNKHDTEHSSTAIQ